MAGDKRVVPDGDWMWPVTAAVRSSLLGSSAATTTGEVKLGSEGRQKP